ncbi:MAG: hypothetical protein KatS3mg038_3635 [Candidatus Kapaibacterium sp.]|nr:MAG: hypothetical protein KatS3mg038_3635 [Candidatus Kapabacteria bacterium]
MHLPDKPPPSISNVDAAAMPASALGSDAESSRAAESQLARILEAALKKRVLKEDFRSSSRASRAARRDRWRQIISIERAQKITYNGKTIASIYRTAHARERGCRQTQKRSARCL